MKKSSHAIQDMHVLADIAGERRSATIAADLAARMDAHLTGLVLSVEPLVPLYPMAAPVPTDFIVAAREAAVADAKAAATAFEKIAGGAGATFETVTLMSIAGEGFAEAVRSLRLSDLAVVGQEDPDHPEPMRKAVIEAMLFDAAVPTLVIPYTGVERFAAARAVVAWDGSAPAATAVRVALPLLARSERVLVVTVEEPSKWTDDVPGADIATHLARHGVDVEVKRITDTAAGVAPMLLNVCADEAADWMVMGAYGHARWREFLLGGATRGVLESMTVPVLMAH